jgi:hypothetical protein
MAAPTPSLLARTAALTVLLVGVLFALNVDTVADAAGYLGIIAVGLVGVTAFAAVRLWFYARLSCKLVALSGISAACAGQLLNATVGLPGASSLRGPLGGWGMLALLLELLTLVLVLLDGLGRTPAPLPEHPYAL